MIKTKSIIPAKMKLCNPDNWIIGIPIHLSTNLINTSNKIGIITITYIMPNSINLLLKEDIFNATTVTIIERSKTIE